MPSVYIYDARTSEPDFIFSTDIEIKDLVSGDSAMDGGAIEGVLHISARNAYEHYAASASKPSKDLGVYGKGRASGSYNPEIIEVFAYSFCHLISLSLMLKYCTVLIQIPYLRM
jgi:hypothetical protein